LPYPSPGTPAIPAAERAVQTGDLAQVRALLVEAMDHALQARFAAVREARNELGGPTSASDVAAARERVRAELGLVTYVESVRQAVAGAPGHGHQE
jgi:hypothetical protein